MYALLLYHSVLNVSAEYQHEVGRAFASLAVHFSQYVIRCLTLVKLLFTVAYNWSLYLLLKLKSKTKP